VLSTVAIDLDVVWIELPHAFIVEFDPAGFRLFDIAEVMTELGRAVV
jgi:hypothetical protein